jgi:lactoylglutathione lyase
MTSALSRVILDVKDIDRSLAFYHGLLDLEVRKQDGWEGHRVAYLASGNTEILLLQQPLEEQNPLLERSGGLVINFQVRHLEAVAIQIQRKHIEVLRDMEEALWGEKTLLVADPDGYAVLLSEPVETLN